MSNKNKFNKSQFYHHGISYTRTNNLSQETPPDSAVKISFKTQRN
jgi:hypothetical protein